MENINSNNLLADWEKLITEFLFIKPSIKFLTQSKNIAELNNLIEWFLIKVEEVYDDKELVNLSMKISKSDIEEKMKIRLLLNINIIMYRLHNNKVLKAELEEISQALKWVF